MLLSNFIYGSSLIISLLSLVSIIYSLKNKDKKINKYIIIVNIVNILYLFIITMLLHNNLPIIVGLEMILIWIISGIADSIYLISTIICIKKNKKLTTIKNNKYLFLIPLTILTLPIIFFGISLFYELNSMNHSTILLSCYSSGNGTIGSGTYFTYVINDKECKKISIDIRYGSLLPKNARKIREEELKSLGFEVFIDDSKYLNFYKDNQLVHKIKLDDSYYNIDLKAIYYNE